ncbi:tetratricopeptide repeat protein [Streptomyces sp. NPDC005794]|uniref:tetratricopeptide repeat protein n=1 Tax=Streptomyces sp. NPDC005794 TaxID=3364733 RepID=UPI0036879ACD
MRGESCTGKTRTSFEAIRVCLKDWQLVFPKNARRLLALLDANDLTPRTVLWLNEAQNFLTGTDGEEAAAALHSQLEQPASVVILGTLWPEYHRTLTTTPEPGKDAHSNARALLNQVKPVDVPASFTATALRNSIVDRDRSLATAMSTSTGGRITQTLAAGPQLVDHYQQATSHSPYGHAVITTAMDARRLGHTSPLPTALLKAAAPGYLTEQQRAAADPDTWFAHALDYAREKVKGVVAALEPVANPDGMGALPDIYRLSDYLDHHARTIRCYAFPPDSFWTAARDHAASTADLEALAEAADQRGRYGIAADLYQRAADAGGTGALAELAWRRGRAGDLDGAEPLAQQAAEAGDTGPLVELAWRRGEAGDLEGAERLAQQAAEAGDTGPLVELAWRRGEAGDLDGAERLAQQAADAGNINALVRLARRHEEAGELNGAERLAQRAADIGGRDALVRLARLRERAGDAEGAKRWRRFGLEADGTSAQ